MQSFSIKGPDARPAELPFGRTVNSFLKNVYLRTGKAFDPASEIKTLTDQDGRPVFSEQEAAYLDNVMTECFVYCVLNDPDIYKVARQLNQ